MVDKILVLIRHWSAKLLSYAGRLQLLLNLSFFWHGDDNVQFKGWARIAWSSVCKPKGEGGLGLQDLESWNLACELRNLWDVIICAGSLWVAWIEAYILKGNSIWHVEIKQNCSCWCFYWNEKRASNLEAKRRKVFYFCSLE